MSSSDDQYRKNQDDWEEAWGRYYVELYDAVHRYVSALEALNGYIFSDEHLARWRANRSELETLEPWPHLLSRGPDPLDCKLDE